MHEVEKISINKGVIAMPETIIVIALLVLIVGFATFYIIKAKKSGKKCIGCPDGGNCHSKNGDSPCCCCGNHGYADNK